jgi:hypothetical protein
VLISTVTAEGIADGSVAVAYRRWDRPRVRPGGTQRTGAGVLLLIRSSEVGYEISPRGRAYLG